jgi:hypothetical protein
MRRPLSTKADSAASSSRIGRWRESWENGTILIVSGWCLFAALLTDRILQKYNAQAQDMDVERTIAVLEQETQQRRESLLKEHGEKPTLATAKVVIPYKMGGSHSLMYAQQNDMVEILQFHTGPDSLYHLCRLRDQQQQTEIRSIGWYPASYLEIIDDKQKNSKTKSSWLAWFGR